LSHLYFVTLINECNQHTQCFLPKLN
jgi:hypothetical protein